MCHDAATVAKFASYHGKLRASLPELKAAADRVAATLKSASLPPQRAAAAAAELNNVRHDLEFLRTANDVHNMHYAAKLCQARSGSPLRALPRVEDCRAESVVAAAVEGRLGAGD